MRSALRGHDGKTQIAVVLAAVGLYELARYAIEPNWGAAIHNARTIVDWEDVVGLGWERPLQTTFLQYPDLVRAMNAFYFLGHFLLTGVFFFWLYHRSRDGFRVFRNGFMTATFFSIVIHWQFPTAPPRLADVGLQDTLRRLSNIDIGSETTTSFVNPVAAVPSLHAGYAVGVGIGLLLFARWRLWRGLGALYPVAVILTIVVTGNHFVLDAIAGVLVLAAGFLTAWLVEARRQKRVKAGTLAHATRGGAVR